MREQSDLFHLVLAFLSLIIVTSCGSLQDGSMYKIISISDGNVFTVNGKAGKPGLNITAEPSQDGANQKWLAVQSGSKSDRFFLVPKWQSWEWNKIAKDTKDRRDSLPDGTMVLLGGDISGSVTEDAFTGKSVQQWTAVEGSRGGYLIKNVNSEQCVVNPREEKKHDSAVKKGLKKVTSIFKSDKKKDQKLGLTLVMSGCNSTDPNQMWATTVVPSI